MQGKRHSKESIVSTLRIVAESLGKTQLTHLDIQRAISGTAVRKHFGSIRNAVEAAGLEMQKQGENQKGRSSRLSDDLLFASMQVVEQKLGHEPNADEYTAEGSFSPSPFKRRFGSRWSDTLAHYRKWKSEQGSIHVTVSEANVNMPPNSLVIAAPLAPMPQRPIDLSPIQLYGEPFDFRGLRHAPINEQGVVYLFGMVSRELGFYVEALQQGFPDCEAKYLHDAKRNLLARARIEFEFKASSFKEHGHDPNKCDLIICWINDWPESPLRVIELKQEILKLSSR